MVNRTTSFQPNRSLIPDLNLTGSEMTDIINALTQNSTAALKTGNSTSIFNGTTNAIAIFNGTIPTPATLYTKEMHQWSIKNSGYNTSEIILTFLFVSMFFIGTLGNGYIFYYFGVKKRARQTIPELLFSYLAVVDFIASVINPTLYTYFTLNRYIWGSTEFLCSFTLSLGAIFTTMSGGIFIIIALDRERTIVFPFKNHFERSTIRWCVIGAIFYSIAMNFAYALRLHKQDGRCHVDDVSKTSYWVPTLVCFLIHDLTLIFVFTFTNVRIFRHIRNKGTASILGALWEKRKRDNAKIIRLLVVLASVYFLLTLPRDIFQMVYTMSEVVGQDLPITPALVQANASVKALSTMNSCANIFIYYRMHKGFQKQIRKMLFCREKSEPSIMSNHTESSPMLSRSKNGADLDRRHINDAVGRKRTARNIRTDTARSDDEKLPMTQERVIHDDDDVSYVIDEKPHTNGTGPVKKFSITRMKHY